MGVGVAGCCCLMECLLGVRLRRERREKRELRGGTGVLVRHLMVRADGGVLMSHLGCWRVVSVQLLVVAPCRLPLRLLLLHGGAHGGIFTCPRRFSCWRVVGEGGERVKPEVIFPDGHHEILTQAMCGLQALHGCALEEKVQRQMGVFDGACSAEPHVGARLPHHVREVCVSHTAQSHVQVEERIWRRDFHKHKTGHHASLLVLLQVVHGRRYRRNVDALRITATLRRHSPI
mmetsp:Transcript_9620/g.16531  ORF Transcript_9620/g.16531 Transcript_9620/m.16531 type:complete len:232 (+) Transcript_9620:634-1329(+)